MITGDKKWMATNHTEAKYSREESHAVYLVGKGIVYYELLPQN